MAWPQRLKNWVKGLFGYGEPPAPEFKPDLSLIQDFTPDVVKEEPLKPPYLRHYHKGNKDLYYITSLHECGIETNTFKAVAKAIEDYKPDIIIVEGLGSGASGQYQQGYIDYAKRNEANGFSNVFEGPYAALLAERNHI